MVLYVVDDEKNIREAIMTQFDWSDLGITSIIGARHGKDALEKMNSTAPDILLSDVRMPVMDGIVLAEKVSSLYPDCIIVFLSGYSDKEYLKSAIHLGALEYIEKPISKDEFLNTMKLAIDKHNQNSAIHHYQSFLENSHSANQPFIQQELLNNLLSTPFANLSQETKELMASYHLSSNSYFQVGILQIQFPQQTQLAAKHQLLNLLLKDSTNIHPSSTQYLISCIQPNEYVFLFYDSNPFTGNDEIISTITLNISYTYIVAMSHITNSCSAISELYNESRMTLPYFFYYDNNTVLAYTESLITHGQNLTLDTTPLCDSLKSGNANMVLNNLEQSFRDYQTYMPNPEQLKKHLASICRLFLSEIEKRPNISTDTYELYQDFPIQLLHSIKLTDAHALITTLYEALFEEEMLSSTLAPQTRRIVQYISDNLGDPQLSVQTISEHLQYSQSYICTCFKKEMNQTINQYITKLRIKQTAYLLHNTTLKLYDIAEQVGINDTNYLSSLFKKHTGLTPLQYRKNESQEHYESN